MKPTLQVQLQELRQRFDGKNCEILSCAVSVTANSKEFLPDKACDFVTELFGLPKFDAAEKRCFSKLLERVRSRKEVGDLVSVLAEIFPTVHQLLKVLTTLPVTTCTVERFFSTLKRVGTYKRVTMLTTRFSSLCVLSFEKEVVENLDREKVIEFFKRKPRRLLL